MLLLLAFAALLGPSQLIAQDETVHDCDRLASRVEDHQRVAPPAYPTKSQIPAAVLACERALKENPGNPRYQFHLGLLYMQSGRPFKGISLVRLSATKSYAAAEFQLYRFIRYNLIKETGSKTAIFWVKRAAEHGNPEAMWALADHYLLGLNVSKDLNSAVYWFRESARAGYELASAGLGEALVLRARSKADVKEGFDLLKKLVRQDDWSAHQKLGRFYVYGYEFDQRRVEFSPEMKKEGVELLKKAANNDDQIAQVDLGKLYRRGLVVERDTEKAKQWYCRAGRFGLSKWGGKLVCTEKN
ncbi:MAG: sel1 repeat family protein [Alphaproteobacteria bacterium]|nr:sel1 repeat family protein [Alphaproteobacteria bacterium]